MSDNSFSIDTTQCMIAHGEIDKAGKAILSLLSELDGDGRVLLDVWEGEAATTYQGRQRQWHQDAEVIVQKLQQINVGLEQAVQIYTQSDRRGVQIIGG